MKNKTATKAVCGHVEIGGKFYEAVKITYSDGSSEVNHIAPKGYHESDSFRAVSPLGKHKFYKLGELENYHCDMTVLACIVPSTIMLILE